MWFVQTFCRMYLIATAIMGNLFLLAVARNALRERTMIFEPKIADWNSYLIMALMVAFTIAGSVILGNWLNQKYRAKKWQPEQ